MSETILWFLIAGVVIFLMMRFGCGSHVMGHGGHGGRAGDDGDRPRPMEEPGAGPPERAVDPVCGMTVNIREAKSAVFEGQSHYFCSEDCRQKFEAAPRSYRSGSRETAAPTEGHRHG